MIHFQAMREEQLNSREISARRYCFILLEILTTRTYGKEKKNRE